MTFTSYPRDLFVCGCGQVAYFKIFDLHIQIYLVEYGLVLQNLKVALNHLYLVTREEEQDRFTNYRKWYRQRIKIGQYRKMGS